VLPLVGIRCLIQGIHWRKNRPLELLLGVEHPLAEFHDQGYLSLILELVHIYSLAMKLLNLLTNTLFLFLSVGQHARRGLSTGIRDFVELSD
jgi:hypothetical protein